jgi:hypothetical protein
MLQEEPQKDRVQEEMLGTAGMQQRHKELRPVKSITSRKQENAQQDFRHTVELEVAKKIVGTSIGLPRMGDWTLWRTQPPPKQKRRMVMIHLDRLAPHEGTAWDEWP